MFIITFGRHILHNKMQFNERPGAGGGGEVKREITIYLLPLVDEDHYF